VAEALEAALSECPLGGRTKALTAARGAAKRLEGPERTGLQGFIHPILVATLFSSLILTITFFSRPGTCPSI